jgi:phage tail-like protein
MTKSTTRRWFVNRAGVVLGAFLAVTVLPISASAQPLPPPELPTAGRFSLQVDGVEVASFSELVGISTEVEPVQFLDDPKGPILKKLPGKTKPPTITLKRGMTDSTYLWAWHEAVLHGDLAQARRDATLVIYRSDGKPVARYHLDNAWPSKLQIGALKAGASQVLTETLTLVAERIERIAP